MELLCGVPHKSSPWNSWAAGPTIACKDDKKYFKSSLSRSYSVRGDEFSKMFGVGSLRSRRMSVTGTMRSTRSAGSASVYGVTGPALVSLASDPTRPASINKHLIPPSPPPFLHPSHDSYSTPLSVVDSFSEYSALPLRRSQTLPPSAIKRGSDRGLFAQMDSNGRKMSRDIFAKDRVDKENINQPSTRVSNQYSVPSRRSNTLPHHQLALHTRNAIQLPDEGPYDIAECKDEMTYNSPCDPLEFSLENSRWNRTTIDRSRNSTPSLPDNSDCYQVPSHEMELNSNDNDTYTTIPPPSSSSTSADQSMNYSYRMCKRHSLASTTSSSAASSRLTSLLGDETLYSGGSLSEAGSSVASFGTSTDEGVYSSSSVTASSIYSSCGLASLSEADETGCLSCQREVETGVRLPCRRARSVRSARQLPVTHTLRRLLQMVLYFNRLRCIYILMFTICVHF